MMIEFIGLFFPIVIIANVAVIVMSLHSFIKHFVLFMKRHQKKDLDECRENLIFFIIPVFISLVYFI